MISNHISAFINSEDDVFFIGVKSALTVLAQPSGPVHSQIWLS